MKQAVDGLRLAESTATGEAIFAALQSIENFSAAIAGAGEGPPPARIVLMTDGKQTVPGPDGENEPRGAFTAARAAAEKEIPVSTISFGTDYGSIDIDGKPTPVAVDDASMQQIAELSGGRVLHRGERGRAAPGLRRARRADRVRDPAGGREPAVAVPGACCCWWSASGRASPSAAGCRDAVDRRPRRSRRPAEPAAPVSNERHFRSNVLTESAVVGNGRRGPGAAKRAEAAEGGEGRRRR